MSDSNIPLSPAAPGGQALDAEKIIGSPDVYRERVQVTGNTLAQIAVVTNTTPTSDAYALAVRPIDGGSSTPALRNRNIFEDILASLKRIEIYLALITDERIDDADLNSR